MNARVLLAAATLTVLGALDPVEAQWVEPRGRGWVDLTAYHLDTREQFDIDGEVRTIFASGHAVSTAAFLTGAFGLGANVDVWAQVPYQRLRFDDARGPRLRSGIGDSRFYVRVAPLAFLGSGLPLAIRGGVKVPVGDFAVDSEIIPLGDGQTDLEAMLELGHSFYPVPVYVNGWVGYRSRLVHDVARRDFSDEAFFLVQGGTSRDGLGGQVVVEGMRSVDVPRFEGVLVPTARRSQLQVTPRALWSRGATAVGVGARFTLLGRNLPAGTSLVLGVFRRIPSS